VPAEPDPLAPLVEALDAGRPPPLAWVLRWSEGGARDPVAEAWAAGRVPQHHATVAAYLEPALVERAADAVWYALEHGPGALWQMGTLGLVHELRRWGQLVAAGVGTPSGAASRVYGSILRAVGPEAAGQVREVWLAAWRSLPPLTLADVLAAVEKAKTPPGARPGGA
jgi:hypothetical protein